MKEYLRKKAHTHAREQEEAGNFFHLWENAYLFHQTSVITPTCQLRVLVSYI